jgi:hypothetical protein
MSYQAIDERMKDGVYCVVVVTECEMCHGKKTFNIPESEWLAWTGGGLIQNVMPSVPEADREILISGTCGPCFDKLFDDLAPEPAGSRDRDEWRHEAAEQKRLK